MSSKKKHKKKLQQKKKRYGAENFLFLTFGICWLTLFAFSSFGGTLHSMGGLIVSFVYLLIPTLVVFLIYNKNILHFIELAILPSPWYLVAILIPLCLGLVSVGVSLQLPNINFSWAMDGYFAQLAKNLPADQIPKVNPESMHPFWVMSIQSMISGLTISSFLALGEELGWRGLLLFEWRSKGFWRSSLLVGLFWGIWYGPLVLLGYNYPENPEWGVLMMILWCTGLSPILCWVRIKGKSIAVAALFHGTVNAVAGLTPVLLTGSSELTGGLLGVSGLITLAIANLILWAFGRRYPLEPVDKPSLSN